MWRNFIFQYMTDVKTSKVNPVFFSQNLFYDNHAFLGEEKLSQKLCTWREKITNLRYRPNIANRGS